MSKQIGDYSRDGLMQITDTSFCDGVMRVTVREMIGQTWEDYGPYGEYKAIRRARTLARSALPEHYTGETKSSRVERKWFANGQSHVTFAVSRNERY